MAKARVTARGLQELDEDMRDRNARYVYSAANKGWGKIAVTDAFCFGC